VWLVLYVVVVECDVKKVVVVALDVEYVVVVLFDVEKTVTTEVPNCLIPSMSPKIIIEILL
jgi:hypothetical protein